MRNRIIALAAVLSVACGSSAFAQQSLFGNDTSQFGALGGTSTSPAGYSVARYGPSPGYGNYGYVPQASSGTVLVAQTPNGSVPVDMGNQQVNCTYSSNSSDCHLGERKTSWGKVAAGAMVGGALIYIFGR